MVSEVPRDLKTEAHMTSTRCRHCFLWWCWWWCDTGCVVNFHLQPFHGGFKDHGETVPWFLTMIRRFLTRPDTRKPRNILWWKMMKVNLSEDLFDLFAHICFFNFFHNRRCPLAPPGARKPDAAWRAANVGGVAKVASIRRAILCRGDVNMSCKPCFLRL